MREESCDIGRVAVARFLVGHKARDRRHFIAPQGEQSPQSIFLRQRPGAETAPDAKHKRVHGLVAQGAVDLAESRVAVGRKGAPQRDRRRPLPIKCMREICGHRTSLLHKAVDYLNALEGKARAHLLVGHMQEFHRLYYHIGEIAVELPGYFLNLLLRFFGERLPKIFHHHLASIADAMAKHEIHECGYRVEHTPRQSCSGSGKHRRQFSNYAFHGSTTVPLNSSVASSSESRRTFTIVLSCIGASAPRCTRR